MESFHMSSATAIAMFAVSWLLLVNCNYAAPWPATQQGHGTAFANGVRIINLYTEDTTIRNMVTTPSIIPAAQLSLVSNTCKMLSTYQVMRENPRPTVQISDLLQMLQATLNHGCFHVRGLLCGEVNTTVVVNDGSGNFTEETVDSCSNGNLHYLDTLCHNASLQVEWPALIQSTDELQGAIGIDEGFSYCKWLSDNIMVSRHMRRLFNHCAF